MPPIHCSRHDPRWSLQTRRPKTEDSLWGWESLSREFDTTEADRERPTSSLNSMLFVLWCMSDFSVRVETRLSQVHMQEVA